MLRKPTVIDKCQRVAGKIAKKVPTLHTEGTSHLVEGYKRYFQNPCAWLRANRKQILVQQCTGLRLDWNDCVAYSRQDTVVSIQTHDHFRSAVPVLCLLVSNGCVCVV